MEKIKSAILRKQSRLTKEILVGGKRPYFENIDLSSRGTLLIGPRGVGKTTFLLSQINTNPDAVYMSLDDLMLQNVSLYELVESFYNDGFRKFFLDEVHYREKWSQEIKSLYDSYPSAKITISDSSTLILRTGTADLSRRFPKSFMPLLSFREYIYLTDHILLPVFDPVSGYKKHKQINLPDSIEKYRKNFNINKTFLSFLEAGQRPFFLEGRYSDRILNIIEKTIFTDIPFFLPSLQKNHLNALSSIVNYISESTIPTINIQTLCNQWEIGKDKVYELLNVLQATGILNVIHNTHSPKGSSKGDKIFFQDCSFYSVLEGNLGSRREAYFTSVLRTVRAAGLDVITSKNEEDGDFVVSDILFELGGKGKSKKRAHVVVKETLDDIYHDQWPLWAFGFLW